MLPCHSQVSGIIEYWNGLPKNQFKYIFDSSSLISSWCIYLHKAVWSEHSMWLCSERDHLFSSTFWLVIRMIFYYFTIWDSSLTIPGHDAFLFTHGNPRLVGWPPSQEGA